MFNLFSIPPWIFLVPLVGHGIGQWPCTWGYPSDAGRARGPESREKQQLTNEDGWDSPFEEETKEENHGQGREKKLRELIKILICVRLLGTEVFAGTNFLKKNAWADEVFICQFQTFSYSIFTSNSSFYFSSFWLLNLDSLKFSFAAICNTFSNRPCNSLFDISLRFYCELHLLHRWYFFLFSISIRFISRPDNGFFFKTSFGSFPSARMIRSIFFRCAPFQTVFLFQYQTDYIFSSFTLVSFRFHFFFFLSFVVFLFHSVILCFLQFPSDQSILSILSIEKKLKKKNEMIFLQFRDKITKSFVAYHTIYYYHYYHYYHYY